ncbi:uncharacterized protein TM35_000013580 [Trypanosoma theileri]|uniref:Transmembrane protein n=1 Tax=Trypanosoma theileri TaxID=67003 RepID=A0A1X0P9G7_9TRYP|nr:uncharacterized protein TM35_000013580 [Trypanosoma theileri]ORC93481.1 hypothetical protein TM35_000013580 [Trypanosoma theileri]
MSVVGSTNGSGSLCFQLLLYCCCGWSCIWFIVTLSLLIYKGTVLYFPPAAQPMEIVSSFLLLMVDVAAFFLGSRGNITEETTPMIFSIILLLVAVLGAMYYMWFQTYVMMLDLAFSATLLAFNGLGLLAGFYGLQAILLAKRAPRHKFAPPPPSSLQQQEQEKNMPTFLRDHIMQLKND